MSVRSTNAIASPLHFRPDGSSTKLAHGAGVSPDVLPFHPPLRVADQDRPVRAGPSVAHGDGDRRPPVRSGWGFSGSGLVGGALVLALIRPRWPSQSPYRSIQRSTSRPLGVMPKPWPPFSWRCSSAGRPAALHTEYRRALPVDASWSSAAQRINSGGASLATLAPPRSAPRSPAGSPRRRP